MLKLLASAAIALASIAPSHAAVATWGEVSGWTVSGNTNNKGNPFCLATATFTDGVTIGITFGNDGMSLILHGTTAFPGKVYSTRIMTSTGVYGTLQGVGIGPGTVMYESLNEAAVRGIKNSQALYVDGLGTYNLSGSAAAMLKTWECYQALTSF